MYLLVNIQLAEDLSCIQEMRVVEDPVRIVSIDLGIPNTSG